MKNAIAIVQARLTSSRLPSKVLKQIGNYSVLDLIYLRLKQAKSLSKVVIAIPENEKNLELAKHIETNLKAEVFKGSERDVLQRFRKCAEIYHSDYYVRITADCPFVLPDLVDKLVSIAIDKNFSYVCNISPPTFADGFDIEVFSKELLFYMDKHFTAEKEREHVTYGFLQKKNELSKIFSSFNYLNPRGDQSSYRLTLDTKEDYEILSKIASEYKRDVLYLEEEDCIRLYNLLS